MTEKTINAVFDCAKEIKYGYSVFKKEYHAISPVAIENLKRIKKRNILFPVKVVYYFDYLKMTNPAALDLLEIETAEQLRTLVYSRYIKY
jgi:hypothetical protein